MASQFMQAICEHMTMRAIVAGQSKPTVIGLSTTFIFIK